MAPPKVLNTQTKPSALTNVPGVVTRRGLSTRQQHTVIGNSHLQKQQPILIKDARIKRKADASPLKDKITKRSALGNITNVCIMCSIIAINFHIYYVLLSFY